MVITLPHLGNVYIAAKVFFDQLGIKYVLPETNGRKALEIGSRFSPDEICLPFKLMVGNYISAIENGADTLVLVGSCGPCRFGEYGELIIRILKKSGYDVNFIIIDSPKDIGREQLIDRLRIMTEESRLSTSSKIVSAIRAAGIMNGIDKMEKMVNLMGCLDMVPGTSIKLYNKCIGEMCSTANYHAVKSTMDSYFNDIRSTKRNLNKNPIKVAIVGEIYTIIEPFANMYIEEKLINLGVSVYRRLTPSWWVKNLLLTPLRLNSLNIRYNSREYLSKYIGGHARECVGETVMASKEGYDGVIQIEPLGCMPEIVAKSIISAISRDKGIPVLSLVVDEMTGTSGFETRIEAFIDMLERRRYNAVYGN